MEHFILGLFVGAVGWTLIKWAWREFTGVSMHRYHRRVKTNPRTRRERADDDQELKALRKIAGLEITPPGRTDDADAQRQD